MDVYAVIMCHLSGIRFVWDRMNIPNNNWDFGNIIKTDVGYIVNAYYEQVDGTIKDVRMSFDESGNIRN